MQTVEDGPITACNVFEEWPKWKSCGEWMLGGGFQTRSLHCTIGKWTQLYKLSNKIYKKRIASLLAPHTFAESDCTMLRRSTQRFRSVAQFSDVGSGTYVYILCIHCCWTFVEHYHFDVPHCMHTYVGPLLHRTTILALHTVVGLLGLHERCRLVVQLDHFTCITKVICL